MAKKSELDYKIEILTKVIETHISMICMYKDKTKDEKNIAICNKSIRISKKAIRMLKEIKHKEIIEAIYDTLIFRNENWFSFIAPVVASKNTKRWDSSEKGFQEFLYENEKAQQKYKEEQEEIARNKEIIAKAKENGDKIEWIKDTTTNRMKPIVVKAGDNNA